MFRYKPERNPWLIRLALVCLLMSGLATQVNAVKPSKSYVSARAYSHYLQSVRTWMDNDWEKAIELIRVALVYDPGNAYIRSRWAQLRWGYDHRLSVRSLRRYIRRAPRQAILYRILALEYWRLGKMARAQQAFRQALKRSNTLEPGEVKNLIRDFSLFCLADGRFDEAFRQIRIYSDSDQDLAQLRNSILVYRNKTSAPPCTSSVDREHNCNSNDGLDVKLVNNGQPMSWSYSLQWGFKVLKLSQLCEAQADPQSCQNFEVALRRLALPLGALQTKDLF